MRDIIKIFAAGAILTTYAVIAPTMVEAVPSAGGRDKPYTQRLAQAEGEAPVSAVETIRIRMETAPRSSLPSFARFGAGL